MKLLIINVLLTAGFLLACNIIYDISGDRCWGVSPSEHQKNLMYKIILLSGLIGLIIIISHQL